MCVLALVLEDKSNAIGKEMANRRPKWQEMQLDNANIAKLSENKAWWFFHT